MRSSVSGAPFRLDLTSFILFGSGSGGSSPIYTVGGTDTSCLSGAGLDNAVVYSSLALGQVPTTLTYVLLARLRLHFNMN